MTSEETVDTSTQTTGSADGASETYLKRRTVAAGEFTEVAIETLGHLDDATIGLLIEVADEHFLIRCDVDDAWSSDTGFATFMEHAPISLDAEVSERDIRGETLELVFNSEMDACGFTPGDYDYDLEYIETSDTDELFCEDYSVETTLHRLLAWVTYQRADPTDCDDGGWIQYITRVDEVSDEEFRVEVVAEGGLPLEWTFDVPVATEEEASSVARLVEEQGGGNPAFLADSGRVVLVHESDVDRYLDVVGYDDTFEEWALVTPAAFSEWEANRERHQAETTTFNEDVDKGEYIEMRRTAFVHGALIPTAYYVARSWFEPMLLSLAGRPQDSANPEVIQAAIGMMDMMMGLGVVMGALMFTIATLKLSR